MQVQSQLDFSSFNIHRVKKRESTPTTILGISLFGNAQNKPKYLLNSSILNAKTNDSVSSITILLDYRTI